MAQTYEEMERADRTRELRRHLRGSEYRFSTAKIDRHFDCNVEISDVHREYTCHTHMTSGLYY